MKIIAEDTQAVIIDFQYKLFPKIQDFEQLELNALRLLQGLKVLEIPMIITEQYKKGLGDTIPTIVEILTSDYQPLEKMTFSCCGEDAFMGKLKANDKENVIICGIESHVCVQQTVIDLIDHGFRPIVIEDCVASRKTSDKITALARMRDEGAIITSYESVLFELCQKAGTEKFKAISRIVK